uniref:mRNA (guanine-N(7))-methyltransferase n=1 Tax=viral metagenome TaxID=1070528 RepID=A0A6C0DCL2_9ZZZZ
MDLRRSDMENLQELAAVWKRTAGAELEAMLLDLDLTGWQDVTSYLRSLGMKEAPQLVKLNICLSNDIRITLEGAGVIQAYCRDNRLTGKPFTAMVKENIADAKPVDITAYGIKAKLKREIPLAADDVRVKEALERWDSLGKHFRMIQRFEFVAPDGVPMRFDISIVRENAGRPARTFQEGRVASVPPRYEAEIELTAKREKTEVPVAVRTLIRGIQWLVQGRQRSFVLCSVSAATYVRESLVRTFGSGLGSGSGSGSGRNRGRYNQPFRYPAPQPATLERRNMVTPPEPGVANLVAMPGGYNVTDKADGLRSALFVSDNGRIFLIDGGGRVYATGKEAPKELAGLVLDGEWIRRDRAGKQVSQYYAFDILADRGGDTGVTGLPFAIAGALLGSAAAAGTRQARMSLAVNALGSATQTVRGVPPGQNLQVGMKTFRIVEGGTDAIYREAAAATLEDARQAPYMTDGLIFTPNAAALPSGTGTWREQLKWKPASENTIDFLVLVDRERGRDGKPTSVDAVGTKYREDSAQTVRFKTLRLFVGSARDAVFQDPRSAVLSGAPLPASLDEGEWREVEFKPSDPRDPMASISYVAIAEEQGSDSEGNIIRAANGDIIQSDMIVEMAYMPERAPGWRWVPTRVRHDKTERWLAAQAGAAGSRRGGTMNADWVANSIWNSIHNPVTEAAVRTGKVEFCPAGPVAAAGAIGRSRGPGRDLIRVQCMTNFHDDWIKKRMLLGRTLAAGGAIADLATGNGSDLRLWLAAGAGRVLACDVSPPAINDPSDGAYSRLLSKMIALGGRDRLPPVVYAVADEARRLVTGEAGSEAEDQALLKASVTPEGYDVVSCMFGIHGMLRDSNTLAGFLTNLADLIKVGGYFVGCGLDGDTVAKALHTGAGVVMGRDDAAEVWTITRRYGTGVGSIVPPSDAGLGLQFDLDFIAAGWSHQEYLVSWNYLQGRLAECGLELLTADEMAAMGLTSSTGLFGDAWNSAVAAGERYEMTDAVRRLSFMNRWWILRRRSDRRPAGPTEGPPAPPVGLTVQRTATAEPAVAPASLAPSSLAPSSLASPAPVAPAAAGAGAVLSAIPEETFDVISLAADEMPPAGKPTAEPPFLVNADAKLPNLRLGEELGDWPRYLTPRILTEITDMKDSTVKYPCVEAALAAAKFQLATDKPELGPQLFRVEGAIHQKFSRERAKGGSAEMIAKLTDDEMVAVRIASGKAKLKAYKAAWNQEAWDAAKEMVYRTYLQQRFEKDKKFQDILLAIKARGGEILFANGTEPTELGVGVLADGTIVGGENKIGRWLMELTA